MAWALLHGCILVWCHICSTQQVCCQCLYKASTLGIISLSNSVLSHMFHLQYCFKGLLLSSSWKCITGVVPKKGKSCFLKIHHAYTGVRMPRTQLWNNFQFLSSHHLVHAYLEIAWALVRESGELNSIVNSIRMISVCLTTTMSGLAKVTRISWGIMAERFS